MYLYCKDLIVLVYLCLPLLLHHYCCTSFLVVHRIATVYRRSTHSIVLRTGEERCDVRVRISVESYFLIVCVFSTYNIASASAFYLPCPQKMRKIIRILHVGKSADLQICILPEAHTRLSVTQQLADMPTRGLVNSRIGPVTDLTARRLRWGKGL